MYNHAKERNLNLEKRDEQKMKRNIHKKNVILLNEYFFFYY